MSTWQSEMPPQCWQAVTVGTIKTEHAHRWDKYLHTAYVRGQLLPREHHCNLCSVCHRIQCETTNMCGDA